MYAPSLIKPTETKKKLFYFFFSFSNYSELQFLLLNNIAILHTIEDASSSYNNQSHPEREKKNVNNIATFWNFSIFV